MKIISLLLVGPFLFSVIQPSDAIACDLCSVYTADESQSDSLRGFYLSVAEQFTGFHRLQNNGQYVENEAHQSMTSSITQIIPRYNFSENIGLQIAVPYISRQYTRPEGDQIVSGSVSGIGDISMLALATPYSSISETGIFKWRVRGGLKLPTGDASELGSEAAMDHAADEISDIEADSDHAMPHDHSTMGEEEMKHGDATDFIPSGIHGHDLALGSGSFDYILGTEMFYERGKVFTSAALQYTIRTEGDFGYRYQNDLQWELGLGSHLAVSHANSLSLKANLSGEYKGMDVQDGNEAPDTGVNSMFAGPELGLTLGNQFSATAALDIPLFVDNTNLQVVPDYRFRVAVSLLF